ncbi:hypothetical protein [Bradyrhizobium sp.]|jgi:hypothetical protein|uniref:hypothetical protein n=1 Tax=Bradyrhizobium sp. TaxID=376 RepID=UPI002C33FF16|nr:hypothetical protein [Bradyrhizobium sp.]HWX59772.1 hypothetical protein [Bradyrhizobium sp.]
MKIFSALILLTLTLMPLSARAETRGTDAALGALSGALVFGPVGAVAGAVVGFTAGPAIGNSWGVNGKGRPRYRAGARSRPMESRVSPDPAAPNRAAMNQGGQAIAPKVPDDNAAASAQARMPTPPATAPAAPVKAPPAQGFE